MSSPSTIVLKSHYYLDHFLEMIEFVGKQYTHAFEPVHDRFLKDFSALSRDGQSLYVRVANRKGPVLPRRSLRYDEIGSIDRAISELSESRFLRSLERKDFPRLLALQKKEELVRLVRSNEACASVPPISARKRKWIEYALANLDWESCFPQTTRESFVVQDRTEELDYFLFLYFGQLSPNLQSFTLRDLGLIRTNEEKTTFSSRFENREIALAAFRYTRLLESLSDKSPEELLSLADQAQSWLPSPDIEIEDRRNRLIRKLGRELERVEKPERALEVYSHSDRFPSTERRVRLLHQDGRVTEVSRLLEKMIENPSCDEELLFAEDFYRRKFQQQRVGRLTSLLRSARELPLDESGRGASENAAARFLASDGIEAHHVENAIWSQLFALLFWDLLFGPDSKHLHSSFDRSPSGLNSGRFFSDHEKEIQRRIAGLDSPDEAIRKLEESFAHADEIPLSLCSLSPDLFALTRRLVLESPRGALAEILEPMTKNHREARRGFPDLILFGDEGVSFLEIKTEGDQIRRHQLVQIERLIAAGFPVEVARVRWIVDPEQEYVVVDVETTGGKAEWNRVTEIGAVKMKGGRLVEEWSTLLNPGRRIPKKIVSLTGITDEMVSDAPVFAEIADEFRAFLGDAVFAAHRAAFDYGFIREEYRRIGEPFSAPSLCTCVSMRRCFPGLASYGLANLCREFNVPLENHHRALADARATAQLLLRINERRLEQEREEKSVSRDRQ